MSSKTLIAMVTIGPDNWTRRFSVARAETYARKHGYDFWRLTEASISPGQRTPHWEKTLIHRQRPGYDWYLIVDDDILINHRIAPAIPLLERRNIGLVREPLPELAGGPVPWVANTGVMLVSGESCDVLEAAYEMGEIKEIVPGFGEQPAVNRVAWDGQRVERMDRAWNYILMADWLTNVHDQAYPWTSNLALSRLAKLTLSCWLIFKMIFRRAAWMPRPAAVFERLESSYFVHLIAYRMGARLVHRYLG
jgi:hypothetical protein